MQQSNYLCILLQNMNRYVCELCPKSYSRQDSLKRHLQIVHEGQRFRCPTCGLNFSRQNNLVRHVQLYNHQRSAPPPQAIKVSTRPPSRLLTYLHAASLITPGKL
jgi:uncharacterized Zn-finger protein